MRRKRTSRVVSLLAATALLLPIVGASARAEAKGIPANRVLHLARPTDPKTLDLAGIYMAPDLVLLPLLNCPLLDVVNGTELTNCAACAWSRSADSRIYTFQLCPKLKGRLVVAADYAYALERIVDPQTRSPQAIYLRAVSGVKPFIEARSKELRELRTAKPGARTRTCRLDRLWSER